MFKKVYIEITYDYIPIVCEKAIWKKIINICIKLIYFSMFTIRSVNTSNNTR